jgi:hypothetical protein
MLTVKVVLKMLAIYLSVKKQEGVGSLKIYSRLVICIVVTSQGVNKIFEAPVTSCFVYEQVNAQP